MTRSNLLQTCAKLFLVFLPEMIFCQFSDFTSYTEQDAFDNIYITTDSIVVRPYDNPNCSSFSRNHHTYVVRDFGSGYFSGDFTHQFDFTVLDTTCSSDGGMGHYWTLSQTDDDVGDLISAGSENFLTLWVYSGFAGSLDQFIRLSEYDSGTEYSDTYDPAGLEGILDNHFWFTIERDELVGTYGTLYAYIYSDEDRTVGVDTLSIALHSSKKDYQFYIPASSRYTGSAHAQVSWLANPTEILPPDRSGNIRRRTYLRRNY